MCSENTVSWEVLSLGDWLASGAGCCKTSFIRSCEQKNKAQKVAMFGAPVSPSLHKTILLSNQMSHQYTLHWLGSRLFTVSQEPYKEIYALHLSPPKKGKHIRIHFCSSRDSQLGMAGDCFAPPVQRERSQKRHPATGKWRQVEP